MSRDSEFKPQSFSFACMQGGHCSRTTHPIRIELRWDALEVHCPYANPHLAVKDCCPPLRRCVTVSLRCPTNGGVPPETPDGRHPNGRLRNPWLRTGRGSGCRTEGAHRCARPSPGTIPRAWLRGVPVPALPPPFAKVALTTSFWIVDVQAITDPPRASAEPLRRPPYAGGTTGNPHREGPGDGVRDRPDG